MQWQVKGYLVSVLASVRVNFKPSETYSNFSIRSQVSTLTSGLKASTVIYYNQYKENCMEEGLFLLWKYLPRMFARNWENKV